MAGPRAAPVPGECFAHPEYETQKLTVPLNLQLDLGLDARAHLPLRSARWWQIQQQHKLLCMAKGLNEEITLGFFHEHRQICSSC